MAADDKEDPATALGKEVGQIIAAIILLCFNTYLLSLVGGWLFPTTVFSFWQWMVMVITIRGLISPSLFSK
jgi:hypothetical protein